MGILRLNFTDDIHKVYVRTEGRRLLVGRSQLSINVPRYGHQQRWLLFLVGQQKLTVLCAGRSFRSKIGQISDEVIRITTAHYRRLSMLKQYQMALLLYVVLKCKHTLEFQLLEHFKSYILLPQIIFTAGAAVV